MENDREPHQIYPLAVVYECINNLLNLDLTTPLSLLDDHEKQWQLREFCTPLIQAAKHDTDHFRLVDKHFSSLLPSALRYHPSLLSTTHVPATTTDLSKAQHLLSRLPRTPQRLYEVPLINLGACDKRGTIWDGIKDGTWAQKYLVPKARSIFNHRDLEDPHAIQQLTSDILDVAWNNMYVTSYIDTNNLVLLVKIASLSRAPDFGFAQQFLCYINLLAALLDEYEELRSLVSFGFQEPLQDPSPSVQALRSALFPEDTHGHHQGLSALEAFLWSAWQRSVMLYFYYIIGVQLWHGPSPEWTALLAVKGVRRLNFLDSRIYRGDSTPYLCNWAFELLRGSRSSLALDFRLMISLFDGQFPGAKGRCMQGSDEACKGDLPDSCHRFTGSEAKSQSAHAALCNGNCVRIRWSESSYRDCPSPRAVLADQSQSSLHYCRSSSNTMAISHVWSHGQGGRPEDGINTCLHQRYCRLATGLGCEAYWIDSACIPEDKLLRQEAIKSINNVFYDSKVTLISDQDLQSNMISNSSMQEFETLLSVLLVCDWGVRAWTMLEAIRGNRAVHILCGNDQTIRLTDLLCRVHQDGAVDLAILLGSAQHLLPKSDAASALEVEETGHLLSQRHASRKNDEIAIWSLLSNLEAHKEPVSIWRGQYGVNTAFLMSSAPRIRECHGYGWAPATPYVRPQIRTVDLGGGQGQQYSVRFPSYDGKGSYYAKITPQGLQGKWLTLSFSEQRVYELCENAEEERSLGVWMDRDPEIPSLLSDIPLDTKLFDRPDYVNACQALKRFISDPFTRVKIIRPLTANGLEPYTGGNARGENFHIPVAICTCAPSDRPGSGDEWQWKGVYEWIDDMDPEWNPEYLLIV